MTAPPNYYWQQYLERKFPAYPLPRRNDHQREGELKAMEEGNPGHVVGEGQSATEAPSFSLKNTMTKWFVDCITAGAIMNTVAFLVIMGIMKGQAGSQIFSNIRTVSHLVRRVAEPADRPGNDPHHRGRLQDLAACVHHQL